MFVCFSFIPTQPNKNLKFCKLKKKCYRASHFRNNLIIMSVSSNRASNCARRLVQEKLCNLLFNNNQKCITVKRNFGSSYLPQTTSNSFMKIYQGNNNKFGTFINSIRQSQVSCQLSKVCQI